MEYIAFTKKKKKKHHFGGNNIFKQTRLKMLTTVVHDHTSSHTELYSYCVARLKAPSSL